MRGGGCPQVLLGGAAGPGGGTSSAPRAPAVAVHAADSLLLGTTGGDGRRGARGRAASEPRPVSGKTAAASAAATLRRAHGSSSPPSEPTGTADRAGEEGLYARQGPPLRRRARRGSPVLPGTGATPARRRMRPAPPSTPGSRSRLCAGGPT